MEAIPYGETLRDSDRSTKYPGNDATNSSDSRTAAVRREIIGYNYTIEYNHGRSNVVADALSRKRETEEGQLPEGVLQLAESSPITNLLDVIREAQMKDEGISKMLADFHTIDVLASPYAVRRQLLFYKDHIVIPENSELRRLLLTECHITPIGGHGGVKRTLGRLTAQFFWPHMCASVQQFVKTCSTCRLLKPTQLKPRDSFSHSDIWSELTMDFITGLPKFNGMSIIMVVVDRLSKAAHFIALSSKYTAQSIAGVFVQEICRLHGFPTSIISERDPLFMSIFWQEFFKASGTQLKHTSAYHPQTDGHTEVTNRGLEQYLRCVCMDQPTLWLRFLLWAKLSYNTAIHSSTRLSPFLIVYGRNPPPLLNLPPAEAKSVAVQDSILQCQIVLSQLQENLITAQVHMKQSADLHHREVQLVVGDKVIVKLQPYQQSSLQDHRFSKLRRRYFGLFSVIKRIRAVAYKLQLPETAKLHPVFHISKLKVFREDGSLHPLPLTADFSNGFLTVKPKSILAH